DLCEAIKRWCFAHGGQPAPKLGLTYIGEGSRGNLRCRRIFSLQGQIVPGDPYGAASRLRSTIFHSGPLLLDRQGKRINVVATMPPQQDQGAVRRYRERPWSHAERYFQNLLFPPVGDAHAEDPIDSPSHEIDVL